MIKDKSMIESNNMNFAPKNRAREIWMQLLNECKERKRKERK